jgi:DNA polymerase
MNLDVLAEEWSVCERCDLWLKRTNVVFGEGNPDADILIVGEAPGQCEDESGRPFMGESGEVLEGFLGELGVNRMYDTFITNVVGCRATSEVETEDGDIVIENRPPAKREREACSERLRQIIYHVDPLVIVAAGKTPASALLGRVSTMQKMRGETFKMVLEGVHTPINYTVMVIYPPAYLLRNPNKAEGGPWDKTFGDLKKVVEIVRYLQHEYGRKPIGEQDVE